MAQRAKRKGLSYKNGYKRYKINGTEQKNKIIKLTKHCDRFPEDNQAIDSLARLKKSGSKHVRSNIKNPGSNKPEPGVYSYLTGSFHPAQTAGEQLSKLLGIVLPNPRRTAKPKPKFSNKPKGKLNVQKST